jgi:endonuclease III
MGKNVVEVEKKLEKVVPKEFKVDVHHWLILHGRYVCTARKPATHRTAPARSRRAARRGSTRTVGCTRAAAAAGRRGSKFG